jgi:hypothetical protein
MSEISLRMPIDPKLQKIANNLTKDIIIPFNEEEIVVEEALSKIEEALSY